MVRSAFVLSPALSQLWGEETTPQSDEQTQKMGGKKVTEYNVYQLHAVKTADGRVWAQRCFICDKSIDFLKNIPSFWVKVGELVRHRKCFPGVPKLGGIR